jgi:LysR family hydrogen peroxide-inducible transcriptional activator
MPLEWEENLTAPLSLLLKNGQLDSVILALPFEEPGIATQPLYRESFRVVVSVTHVWARKKGLIDPCRLRTEKSCCRGRPLLPPTNPRSVSGGQPR